MYLDVLTLPCWTAQSLDLEDNAAESASDYSGVGDAHFYEVTIGSVDQPKLLSRLTDALVSPPWLCMLGEDAVPCQPLCA